MRKIDLDFFLFNY